DKFALRNRQARLQQGRSGNHEPDTVRHISENRQPITFARGLHVGARAFVDIGVFTNVSTAAATWLTKWKYFSRALSDSADSTIRAMEAGGKKCLWTRVQQPIQSLSIIQSGGAAAGTG